jgi:hypothetical protein
MLTFPNDLYDIAQQLFFSQSNHNEAETAIILFFSTITHSQICYFLYYKGLMI